MIKLPIYIFRFIELFVIGYAAKIEVRIVEDYLGGKDLCQREGLEKLLIL